MKRSASQEIALNAKRRQNKNIHDYVLSDVRVNSLRPLLSPAILVNEELTLTAESEGTVLSGRLDIKKILAGEDDRLLVVIGPCSIHDTKAALEYTDQLVKEKEAFKNELLVVMRVYFEKPRTSVGWKGLINDPDLNGTFNINKGLRVARKLLLDITGKGMPVACEFLDTISPQFLTDLVTWGAIGARTTECQLHRELASGLSCPIGFKNPTSGNVQKSVDAILSASQPHHFLGVTKQGNSAIVETTGNEDCHIVLRGSDSGPNYSKESVLQAASVLEKAKISSTSKIMIDCSHGNSQKIHTNQKNVALSVAEQVQSGNTNILGVMIESNINEGKQSLVPGKTDLSTLKYGVSCTDACIDLKETTTVLTLLADAVKARRALKQDS